MQVNIDFSNYQKRCNTPQFGMAFKRPVNLRTGLSADKEFIKYTHLPESKKALDAFIDKCDDLFNFDIQPQIPDELSLGVDMAIINRETNKQVNLFGASLSGETGIGYESDFFYKIKKFFYSKFAPEKLLPKNMLDALKDGQKLENAARVEQQAEYAFSSLRFFE